MGKPPLILLHGALGNRDSFTALTPLLEPDFDVHSFHFSGHDGQPYTGLFSIEQFVNDTMEYMLAHQISSAHFFGYSMGGYVAVQLAAHYPDRVRRIITLGTKWEWTFETAAREVKMLNPDIIRHKVPAFAETLSKRFGEHLWEEVVRSTAHMMIALGNGKAMTDEIIRRITTPVLVCRGEHDYMVHEAESIIASACLPKGKLQILKGLQHPLETAPAEVLATLCKSFFLDT